MPLKKTANSTSIAQQTKASAPGVRARKVEQVLQIVVSAALEEFADNGFKGARMQRIADRAGLPKANVHYYFKDKSSLYLAVLDSIVERWNNTFEAFNTAGDPALLLDQFVREKVQFSFEAPSASRLFASEIIQGAPHLAGHINTVIRPYVNARVAVIQDWVDTGRIAPVEPMQLIFLIWSATQHYADFQAQVLLVSQQRRYSKRFMQETSDFLSAFILRGCGLAPLPGSVAS